MKRYLVFKNTLVTILLLAFVIACKDDPEPSVEKLLAKKWEVVSVEREGQPMGSSVYSVEFESDGDFEFNTPGVPGLPQSGTWTYDSSRKIITLNPGSVELKIMGEVARDKLVFEYVYSNHKMGDVEIVFRLR